LPHRASIDREPKGKSLRVADRRCRSQRGPLAAFAWTSRRPALRPDRLLGAVTQRLRDRRGADAAGNEPLGLEENFVLGGSDLALDDVDRQVLLLGGRSARRCGTRR
jgi:hypothetical protein